MSLPDHCSIQEFLFGWISSGTPRAVERFSDKRDPAGFLSYFLKLQNLFRSPAMSLARWPNVTWNSFKPQVPSGLYKTCSADGHTRVCPRLVVACVHCRVRTEHYSQIGGGLAVWSRYFTWPLPTLHDTVHSHGLRNLEIIVFNLLNDELVSFVAADFLLWSSRSLISIKLLGFGFWFWWFFYVDAQENWTMDVVHIVTDSINTIEVVLTTDWNSIKFKIFQKTSWVHSPSYYV